MYNVIKKNRMARTNKNGSYASTTPAEVATALPPLKLANRGNICPITATTPTINGCISAPLKFQEEVSLMYLLEYP